MLTPRYASFCFILVLIWFFVGLVFPKVVASKHVLVLNGVVPIDEMRYSLHFSSKYALAI